MTFKNPMLAPSRVIKPSELLMLPFPVLVSPKLDGIRCTIQNGQPLTRTLKAIPNLFVRDRLSQLPDGLDGELILGSATADDAFNRTQTAVMTRTGEPDVHFHVFDRMDLAANGFEYRTDMARAIVEGHGFDWLKYVPHHNCMDPDEVLGHENDFVTSGYEGLMIRSRSHQYLHGRAGFGALSLLKFKRYYDGEAIILEVLEGFVNANPQKVDATGHLKRGASKAGMVPSNMCGGLRVRDLVSGVVFNCAPGKMTDVQAREIWQNRDAYVGKTIKYQYGKAGGYLLPRFPTFQGFRQDME